MINFTDEKQLLDKEFRRRLIKELIDEPENVARKNAQFRRHEIYRDKTVKYVMNELLKEGFKATTIAQIRNRATNVSVARKIVNKLAQVYTGGVDRKAKKTASQKSIDALADELDFNTKMKTANRFRKLFRNTMVQVVPVKVRRLPDDDDEGEKYRLQVRVRPPWQYDVIPDPADPTQPAVVIDTEFTEHVAQPNVEWDVRGAQGYRSGLQPSGAQGELRDQRVETPEDRVRKDNRRFIVWSDSYHFTFDVNGDIVTDASPEDLKNPIQTLPYVNYPDEQDGEFWAQGGDDIIEESVGINKKLTDIEFISFVQGWGQLVIAAPKVPTVLTGGPDNAFVFEIQKDDPVPLVQFVTSNPPIEQHLKTLTTRLAMLLSTNNLSTRHIAATLDSQNPASGVALLIDNSEVQSDLKDEQVFYQDREPEVWLRVKLWHTLYHEQNALVPDQQAIAPFQDHDVTLKFHQVKPPISEAEHLADLKARKDLGLNTLVELLKRDNPDLTDDEAEQKRQALLDEKSELQDLFGTEGEPNGSDEDEEKGPREGEGEGEKRKKDQEGDEGKASGEGDEGKKEKPAKVKARPKRKPPTKGEK